MRELICKDLFAVSSRNGCLNNCHVIISVSLLSENFEISEIKRWTVNPLLVLSQKLTHDRDTLFANANRNLKQVLRKSSRKTL